MGTDQAFTALCEFVIRVAKGNATPEEIAVLPEVAKVVLPR